jgi:hypothetical protein
LAVTLSVAACAGGGAKGGGVASLSGSGKATTTTTTTTTPSAADAKQAALSFARCMRQHGIDMPDPKFDANGGMSITAGPNGVGPDDPRFKAAQQACQQYLPNGGNPTKPNPEQQQQALKFARCMRQHGIDMPDPSPNGGMSVQGGSGGNSGPRPDDPTLALGALAGLYPAVRAARLSPTDALRTV